MRRDLGSQLILIASQRDPKLFTDKFFAFPVEGMRKSLRLLRTSQAIRQYSK